MAVLARRAADRWGKLTPHPPNLGSLFGWDKLEHFTANSIGALGGLGVAGFLAV
jgi:hypothetical protein